MAKKGLYVVVDNVAESYSPVFQEINDRTAKRSFLQQIKQSPYPGDYSLQRVGWIEGSLIISDFEPSIEDTIDTEVNE